MPPPSPKPLDRIMVSLRLRKPQGGLTRDQAMAAWPIRNPSLKWEAADDVVAIHLPRRQDWTGRMLGFFFMVPESRPVQLDEVGSFVWHHCDGEHTVSEIADALAREYQLNRREAEVSLTEYLQTLGKRGMVAFAVPREVAEAAGLQGQDLIPQQPSTAEEQPGRPPEGETAES